MARKRCNSCQGEYDDVGADGLLYFHSCPPVTRVRVTRDGQAQTVDVADVRPTDSVRVQRAGRAVDVVVSELQPDDVRLGDGTGERPDRRDENAALLGGEEEADARGREGRRRIKAIGRGATVVRS